MPVMDGYDATRAIRSWEASQTQAAGSAPHIPIVALTANALVGDADICRAAGMDDHLPKPYSRKQLVALMARWLPAGLVENAPAEARLPAPAPKPVDTPCTLDKATLAHIRALEEDGSSSILDELIGMYLEEAPSHIANLQAAAKASNAAALGRIAHAFKSASANVGASQLSEMCRQVERHAKAGEVALAAALIDRLEAHFHTLRPTLLAEVGQPA